MLRPILRITRIARTAAPAWASQIRSIHHVPTLNNLEKDKQIQEIPEFLTAESMDLAWTQNMTFLLSELDARIQNLAPEFEQAPTKEIALKTAREPDLAAVFNYASMAHNTEFFFRGLSRSETDVPEPLRSQLEQSFGSAETLRREMLGTALGMFGPGFVWLAQVADKRTGDAGGFRVLPTYAAGSPYSGAHWRRQGVDMGAAAGAQQQQQGSGTPTPAQRNAAAWTEAAAAGARGANPKKDALAPGGIDVVPVLCLSTWEHVWLRDWGFGAGGTGGKRVYVEQWWRRIDWNRVLDLSNQNLMRKHSYQRS